MIPIRCSHLLSATAFSAFAFAAVCSPAHAHIVFANAEAAPNSYHRAVLQVPHGCDGEATTAIRVQIPEGVIAVKPMPKAGWTLTTTRGAYAKSYQNHGQPVIDGVKEIVWSGGNLSDDHFDEFVFSALLAGAATATTLYFPVVQQCTKGEAAWTEIPSGQQSPRDLKKPAPSLRLTTKGTTLAQAAPPHDHGAMAGADTFKAGDITISAPWTRATPGGAKVAGGYLKVTNNGKTPDKLLGGMTSVAGRMEIHEMTMSGGVMQMRPQLAGLEIKPGETVELKPGGFHVMFLDLKRQLKDGETVNATLQFEQAGTVEVTFKVGPIGGSSSPHQHH